MQVVNAQAAHVALVLISNSDDTGFIRLEPDQPVSGSTPPNITTPSASLPQNSGRPLYDALASGQALTVTITAATLPKGDAKLYRNMYLVVHLLKLCPTLANFGAHDCQPLCLLSKIGEMYFGIKLKFRILPCYNGHIIQKHRILHGVRAFQWQLSLYTHAVDLYHSKSMDCEVGCTDSPQFPSSVVL